MDDDDDASDYKASHALERIARSLDVPTASFFASAPCTNVDKTGVKTADEEILQALAVMRLFLKIKDPEARARCVSFITQELLKVR